MHLRSRYDVSENTVGDNGIILTRNRSAFPAKSFEIHSRLGVLDKPVADTENKDECKHRPGQSREPDSLAPGRQVTRFKNIIKGERLGMKATHSQKINTDW